MVQLFHFKISGNHFMTVWMVQNLLTYSMNFAESIALAGLRRSKTASAAAYKLAKTSTSVTAPFVLQFFCIIHEKILNEESKQVMNDFFKNHLSLLHTKYEILTVLCQNEIIDPMSFIHEHQAMVQTMLTEIGIDPHIIETEERLIQSINQNIQRILAYIETKTDVLKQLKLGGTRRRKYKRRRTRVL